MLMVVLVLAALVAIATPFALSMGLHERKARSFRDTTRARLAAEGAVARAISTLRRTEDHAERARRYGPPWVTPDYDTEDEFRVDFEKFDAAAVRRLTKAGIRFDDPRGAVWSARVEDEQGKINVLSAPPEVIGCLVASGTLARDLAPGDRGMLLEEAGEFFTDGDKKTVDGAVKIDRERIDYTAVDGNMIGGLRRGLPDDQEPPTYRAGTLIYAAEADDIVDAARGGGLRTLHDMKAYVGPEPFERVSRLVTTNSFRESSTGWFRREEVVSGLGVHSDTVTVREAHGLGPCTRVRFVVSKAVRPKVYRVAGAVKRGERWHVKLDREIGFDRPPDSTVYLEAEQRHPVNVNTAPIEVLAAVFTGVAMRGAGGVTREEAKELALYVHDYVRRGTPGGKPLASEADVKAMFNSASGSGAVRAELTPRKVQALVENATVTNSPELGRSTLPFCFKAYGNFTIEAAALVNTRAGRESSRYVVRQLVTLPVASGGCWTLSSQKDFDEQMKRLTGRKVVTWPLVEPPTSDSGLKRYTAGLDPRTGRDRGGYVRPDTGRCPDDGLVDHFQPGGGSFRGSRELTPDGAVLKGGSVSADGSKVFALDRNGACRPAYIEAWVRPETRAGPLTVFSAFAGAGGLRDGFDLRYQRDMLVLRVSDACLGQNDDASWDGRAWMGPARYEFSLSGGALEPGDWYHVAAQVTGTGPNDATLWIDGRPVAGNLQADNVEYRPGTRLVAALDGTDSIADSMLNGSDVVVDSTRDFPKDGAILVDGEVIEYSGKDGTSFKGCRRARRYTNLASHAAGTVAIPYGYSVPLARKFVAGNATIASDLAGGKRIESRLPEKEITLPGPPPLDTFDLLEEDATVIPVEDAGVFQSSGYAVIRGRTNPEDDPDPTKRSQEHYSELIYFGAASRTGNELRRCVRRHSLGGTSDGERMNVIGREFLLDGEATVTQISIAVTGFKASDYQPVPGYWDPGHYTNEHARYNYACIKSPGAGRVEWIRLEYVDEKTKPQVQYLLGAYEQGRTIFRARVDDGQTPMDPWRGRLGTEVLTDTVPDGAKLLPILRLLGPQCGHRGSFRALDLPRVTLLDSGGVVDRALHVTHGATSHGSVFRVSLDDFVTRDLAAGSGRLLKFPSGEMPRQVPGRLSIGPIDGTVDEVRALSFDLRPFRVARGAAVTAAADEIVVSREWAMDGANRPFSDRPDDRRPPDRGVVRIDDELVYYGQRQGAGAVTVAWGHEQRDKDKGARTGVPAWTLAGCARGILGTQSASHADGARVTFLPGFSVSHISEFEDDRIKLASSAGFPEEGYAVIRPTGPGRRSSYFSSDEIVGWTRKSGEWLEGMEFLRGRFGTKDREIRTGYLAQRLPFRYWSRYVPDHDGSELAYFQTSVNARGAHWRSIEWAENDFHGKPVNGMEIRVVCRFEGKPGWETRPSNRPGGLWELKGAGTHTLGSRGAPLVADSMEVRVYFSYTRGVWAAGSSEWKRTLGLDNLTVTFGSPLVVRKVDLLDY
jgi:hypothetical protein